MKLTDEQKAALESAIAAHHRYCEANELRGILSASSLDRLAAEQERPHPLAGKSCRTGHYDICNAAKRDGVVCAEGECDIDSGMRPAEQERLGLYEPVATQTCPMCNGTGSHGGRMHIDAKGNGEYEPYKCDMCDGIGTVATPSAKQEPICQDCGDSIVAHDPGVCGNCYSMKYDAPQSVMSDKQEAVGEVYAIPPFTRYDKNGIGYEAGGVNAVRMVKELPPGTKLYAAPLTHSAEQDRIDAEQLQALLDDVTAIDTWYRGSPSYEHDAGWFKDRVVRLIEERIKGASK